MIQYLFLPPHYLKKNVMYIFHFVTFHPTNTKKQWIVSYHKHFYKTRIVTIGVNKHFLVHFLLPQLSREWNSDKSGHNISYYNCLLSKQRLWRKLHRDIPGASSHLYFFFILKQIRKIKFIFHVHHSRIIIYTAGQIKRKYLPT